PSLFDQDQRCAAMNCLHFAVLGDTSERIIRVDDTGIVVEHSARRLPEAEIHRRNALDRTAHKLCKLFFIIESVWHVIEDLKVVGEHVERLLQVFLVESINELLSKRLNFLNTHRCSSWTDMPIVKVPGQKLARATFAAARRVILQDRV